METAAAAAVSVSRSACRAALPSPAHLPGRVAVPGRPLFAARRCLVARRAAGDDKVAAPAQEALPIEKSWSNSFLPCRDLSALFGWFCWVLDTAAALACAAAATVVVARLIYRHLLHYAEPTHQRFIVRVIFMVPVYAVMSFLSLALPDRAIYFNSIREMRQNEALLSSRRQGFCNICFKYVFGDPCW